MLLLIVPLTACTDRGEDIADPDEGLADDAGESSQPEEVEEERDDGRPTLSQAKRNNERIDADSINLVQFEAPKAGDMIATITTELGEIQIKLFHDYAPKAVENFTTLAEEGYFDEMDFHYVLDGYAIKSGGTNPSSVFTNSSGDEVPFADEFTMDLWHFRGAVTCVSDYPDSNTSEFAIIQAPEIFEYTAADLREAQWPEAVIERYIEVGGAPHMDWSNSIFGMVISGMDIVDQIAAMDADDRGMPEEPVVIQSVVIDMMS